MLASLPVLNAVEAKFECIFGRGCDGICCQNGRPGVYPDEAERIDANLEKILPLLRPEARKWVEESGYLSGRRKLGMPMLRVVKGWCIFFNEGCTLHKLGATEGDKYRYKPWQCVVFPLAKDAQGEWFIRQKGYKDEEWDLFCLDPRSSPLAATETLQEELAFALRDELKAKAS